MTNGPKVGRSGSAAPLRIEPVSGTRDLERFIRLPNRLYRDEPGYIPPLLMERRATLRFDKNPYFRHARGQYWLAWKDGRPVGRISAQIDDLHLAQHGDATGHFGFLDAEDDSEIFRALTAAAEEWVRSRGMRRILGPFSLSTNEECGLLVDGFSATPMMMMPYHPPYAGARLAEQGYGKAKDLIAYDYEMTTPPSRETARLLDRAAANKRIALRTVNMARYREDLSVILDIFNDAWSENWGFVPFTEAEIAHIASSLRPLIRPELVWIAEVDGTPGAMIVCLPNLLELIADLDGKLLPFGWLKLLWRLKLGKIETCRVPLFGVRKRFHRSPLGSTLVMLLLESLRAKVEANGFRGGELSWILEDNIPMRRIIESFGGKPYKTYRIYEKALS